MQIVAGIGQVALGLLMVWLSKQFIDVTIREGAADDVLRMVCWLVMTVVGGVILRQVIYWLKTSAGVRQTSLTTTMLPMLTWTAMDSWSRQISMPS